MLSSALRSVAVVSFAPDGQPSASSEVVDASPAATVKPFEMIEQALRETAVSREAIECIAVGIGPGSYTGIRAAIALAQGQWSAAAAELSQALSVLGEGEAPLAAWRVYATAAQLHQAQGRGAAAARVSPRSRRPHR